jgi:hypothetical protein
MKMNSIIELQNPKGSYVYRCSGWVDGTTPSGSNMARLLGFSINITILRSETNQLKEDVE